MRTGIVLTENFELAISVERDATGKITKGIQIGQTDLQNMQMIVQAAKGEFKEYPLLGVSPALYLKSTGKEKEFIRECTVQLLMDGYKARVVLNNGNLKIDIQE